MSQSPEHGSAQLLPPPQPTRWVRASDAIWRTSVDRVIVSLPRAQQLLILTGTAAELWHALAEPVTVEGLSRQMSTTFDGSAETIAADIAHSLQELTRQGAVRALT